MPVENIERDLGRLEAKVENHGVDLASVKKDVSEIKAMLSEAKGGWRVLMLVAGVAGALGALMTKFIPFLATAGK